MKYYVVAKRTDLDGFTEAYTVGYDNRATTTYENFMFFDTPEEAEEWTNSKEAAEWKDCSFDVVEDEE